MKFVYTAFSALNSLSLGIRMPCKLQGQAEQPGRGGFVSCFQGAKKGPSVFLALDVFVKGKI